MWIRSQNKRILSNVDEVIVTFVDENKWTELDETTSQFEWVKNFYDRFIKPLDDNTLLTIFECKK